MQSGGHTAMSDRWAKLNGIPEGQTYKEKAAMAAFRREHETPMLAGSTQVTVAGPYMTLPHPMAAPPAYMIQSPVPSYNEPMLPQSALQVFSPSLESRTEPPKLGGYLWLCCDACCECITTIFQAWHLQVSTRGSEPLTDRLIIPLSVPYLRTLSSLLSYRGGAICYLGLRGNLQATRMISRQCR